jgi:hypothetical protein
MDPDPGPGGPKTYGSGFGSGSATMIERYQYCICLKKDRFHIVLSLSSRMIIDDLSYGLFELFGLVVRHLHEGNIKE